MKRHLLALTLGALLAGSLPAWADSYLDRATAAVTKATASVTEWDGPTTGPTLQKNKKVIFIASDMKNGGVQGVQQGLSEAAGRRAGSWKPSTVAAR